MPQWVDFIYGGFYDVPRRILLQTPDGRRLLLDCGFDEALDDYPAQYTVYVLPEDVDMSGSWAAIPDTRFSLLGTVPVVDVRLDATKRRQIDAEALLAAISASR